MACQEFKEFAALFQEAEQGLKQIEHLTDTLHIPAINELRYAGFHAVQAMAAASADERSANIEKGERHCRRASFDVFEVGIA
jgi:hypothetical protein